ncbi:hypothetical protein HK101_007832 [Irineochytrium annulatum]|nr:hypothetical protein HK101_007832 [Irineochytrium annulatum]
MMPDPTPGAIAFVTSSHSHAAPSPILDSPLMDLFATLDDSPSAPFADTMWVAVDDCPLTGDARMPADPSPPPTATTTPWTGASTLATGWAAHGSATFFNLRTGERGAPDDAPGFRSRYSLMDDEEDRMSTVSSSSSSRTYHRHFPDPWKRLPAYLLGKTTDNPFHLPDPSCLHKPGDSAPASPPPSHAGSDSYTSYPRRRSASLSSLAFHPDHYNYHAAWSNSSWSAPSSDYTGRSRATTACSVLDSVTFADLPTLIPSVEKPAAHHHIHAPLLSDDVDPGSKRVEDVRPEKHSKHIKHRADSQDITPPHSPPLPLLPIPDSTSNSISPDSTAPLLPCPVPGCSALFKKRNSLSSHMVSHSERRANGCGVCGMKFKRKHDLVRHMKTLHDASRFFRCMTCNQRFSKLNHLMRHTLHETHEADPDCLPTPSDAVGPGFARLTTVQ